MLVIVLSCVLCSHFMPFFPKLGWYTIPYKVDYLLEVTDVNGDTKNVKGKTWRLLTCILPSVVGTY